MLVCEPRPNQPTGTSRIHGRPRTLLRSAHESPPHRSPTAPRSRWCWRRFRLGLRRARSCACSPRHRPDRGPVHTLSATRSGGFDRAPTELLLRARPSALEEGDPAVEVTASGRRPRLPRRCAHTRAREEPRRRGHAHYRRWRPQRLGNPSRRPDTASLVPTQIRLWLPPLTLA